MSSRADADPASSKEPGAGESSSARDAIAGDAAQTVSPVIPSSPPRLTHGDGRSARASEELDKAEKGSDSEAETIVLDGKESDRVSSPSSKQAIKHENDSDEEEGQEDVEMKDVDGKDGSDEPVDRPKDRPVKKRHGDMSKKDGPAHEAGNSSGLSSAPTSPVARPRSSKKDGSESDRSRSSAPNAAAREKPRAGQKARKRKIGEDGSDDDEVENGSKPGDARRMKEKRETRSATARPSSPKAHGNRRVSNERSLSPRVRTHRRAASTQSATQGPNGHTTKKRKLPPPLQATRERKQSEDVNSDTSSTSGSPHPSAHLRKMTSVDSSALSPAKMPPHKKHRDQIGRTFLARACANSELDAAKTRLKDRPQDVDEADYAGNTPLQIASLEGSAQIVKLLIDSGCDVHCKNNEKDTPLIDAVENSHLEVVRLLLNAGANPKQGNAKGEEPLDLLDDTDENYEAIRKALLDAIKSGNPRRQSEDHSSANAKESGRSSRGASTHSPRHSPTAAPPRSPPSSAFGARRRNARSEVSRNDLLWMSASQEGLRELAGKGDLQGVGRILEMRPQSDTESFIAAARGGHDEVMQLLLAMGNAEPDPDPIKSATYKQGFNTPMLAAIGRGSDKVIKLLLEQQNFDPTRTDHRGRHYHEIAKERQGLGWEKEYELLKSAYEKHSKGRKVRPSQTGKTPSPEASRQKVLDREGKRSSKIESTLQTFQKPMKSPKDHRSGEQGSSKHDSGKKENKRSSTDSIASRSEKLSKPGLSSKSSSRVEGKRAGSVVVSDGESTVQGNPKVKVRRSESDSTKPRRKLMSGAALKGDREKPRRVSSMSGSDTEERPAKRRIKVEIDGTKDKDGSRSKPDDARSRVEVVRSEAAPKRPRDSTSPPRSSSLESESRKARDDTKSKRRRIDSESNGTNAKRVGHESLKVKSVNSENTDSRSHSKNMDKMSQSKALTDKSSTSTSSSPGAKRKASSVERDSIAVKIRKRISKSVDRDAPTDTKQETIPKETSEARKARIEAETKTKEEKETQRKLEQEREAQLQREQAESLARAQKKAEEDKKKAEAARLKQEQADKEEADRQAKINKEKEEAAEKIRQAEEAERALRVAQEEEEARIEKKRRDEEAHKRRLEQEQRRREEAERRRREAEERERVEQLRRQEEEERRRRAALPNKLRWQAERPVHEIRTRTEAESFLPLMQAPLGEIDPRCSPTHAREMWIANYEAAAILGEKDLALSHFTAWEKRPFDAHQTQRMWRLNGRKLAGYPLTYANGDSQAAWTNETEAKFKAMEPKFWIKYNDFKDILPRYPHLRDLKMRCFEAKLAWDFAPLTNGATSTPKEPRVSAFAVESRRLQQEWFERAPDVVTEPASTSPPLPPLYQNGDNGKAPNGIH